MQYIDSFTFATPMSEEKFLHNLKRTCYDTYYPFQIFPQIGFRRIDFDDITVLCGGNGTGKSTVLNLIANKINADRTTVYNRSNFFEDYIDKCEIEYYNSEINNKMIITSDGVFDYMLDVRAINTGVDKKREELFDDYMELKYSKFKFQSMEDYENLRKVNSARSNTQSSYIRKTLQNNVREHSNGESAFKYFISKIEGEGVYLLDEPENSLSPDRQLELVKYIEDSARFYNSQFIISTHSPFILAMRGAKIYNMDVTPVDITKWTELTNVRQYYEFFKQHDKEFE